MARQSLPFVDMLAHSSALRLVLPLIMVLLTEGLIEKSAAFASYPRKVNEPSASVNSELHEKPPIRILAQNQPSPDLKQLLGGSVPPDTITSRTPSPIFMSIPSLWWVAEQIATFEKYGPKLIQDWIAYPIRDGQSGRVDLLVNRQLWSLLDYLQRYELVSRFSAIARSYGYNTHVYDNPDRAPVASYTCNFTRATIRLLQTPIRDQSLQSPLTDFAGRDEIANRLTCNLDLEPVNRPRRLNSAIGN